MSPLSLSLALVLSILMLQHGLIIIMIPRAEAQTYLNYICLQSPGLEHGLNAVKFCRGDVPSSDCGSCLSTAETTVMNLCPIIGGVIWYDYCEFKNSIPSAAVLDHDHSFSMASLQTVSDPRTFNGRVQQLLSQLAGECSVNVNPPKYFAKGSVVVDGSMTVYGLTQCSLDLTSSDCWTCLQFILRSLSSCCDGKVGGRIVTVSCNFRSRGRETVRVKNASGDQAVAFGFTADYRMRLDDPSVPENYFGNRVSSIYRKGVEAKQFMNENWFEFAMELVSEAVEHLKSDPMADLDRKVTTLFGYLNNPNLGQPMQAISVARAPRFGIYGVDFGWGRPELVETVSVDRSGAIGLVESHGGGNVEVGLVMKKDEMKNLVQVFFERSSNQIKRG